MFLHVSVILFTGGVSVSVLGGGGLCPGGSLSGGGGGSVQGEGSVWRVSVMETPPYGNERAVRILLECILVFLCFLVFPVTNGNPV